MPKRQATRKKYRSYCYRFLCYVFRARQLLALFWTDTSIDDESGGKAIAHFSGVLGIHPYKLTLHTAYDYTPYLSALIWVGRLVLLEYALPLRTYGPLSPPLRARAAYPDQESRLLREIRPKYLQLSTFAPLGYLVERLQHGRATAKREEKINQEAQALMFHWWPGVNLHKIKDDLVSYRPGYSFLEESENDLRMTCE
ncbi:hypothetical protein DM02DRAFT_636685 [Periconia macrospinosa]|uniref:Uncharacterized protein n=1 Tax=Periconia macrospinosa TaxID=97972 RepID=A0A2V1CY14_9PLEO|nr:hypothetical protein DM02DRAFT_636685 [Periconia macrospinosa]